MDATRRQERTMPEAGNGGAAKVDDAGSVRGSARREGISGMRVVREGTLAGVCGYLTVVIAVVVVDLLAGRPVMHTASQLGAWLFHPAEDAITGPAWPSAVAYNGLHLLASLVVGIVAALAVSLSERFSGFWYVALMALVAVGIYTLGALGAVAVEFKGIADWPTVVVGTGAWLLGISAYLWYAHPRLLAETRRRARLGE
jgi:hypothetical protein